MNEAVLERQKEYLCEKYKNKTVLVAGSTGLIGSRITSFLLTLNDEKKSNIKIICLYRSEDKKNKLYKNTLQRKDIVFLKYDMEKELEYSENVDYIFHCAGISGGAKMHLKNPTLMWETAYLTTKGLLDFAVSHNCKSFLFISTYEVYGNINSEELIKENSYNLIDTSQLRNIYPISKQMCESMCIAYSSKYGIKTSSARLTSTFGNGVKYDDARFFAEFARCMIENRDIVLKSTGGTVRSYLDSDDAATAFLYIAADTTKEQNYNVTNMSNEISIKEIAEKMISVSGSNVKIVFDIAEDIKSLGFRKEGCTLMDAEKLYSLGWEPVYTIEDTIEKLLDSMKTDKK